MQLPSVTTNIQSLEQENKFNVTTVLVFLGGARVRKTLPKQEASSHLSLWQWVTSYFT